MLIKYIIGLILVVMPSHSFENDGSAKIGTMSDFLNKYLVNEHQHNWTGSEEFQNIIFTPKVTRPKVESISRVKDYLEQVVKPFHYNCFKVGKTFVFIQKDDIYYHKYYSKDTVIENSSLNPVTTDYYQIYSIDSLRRLVIVDTRYLSFKDVIKRGSKPEPDYYLEISERIVDYDSAHSLGLFSNGVNVDWDYTIPEISSQSDKQIKTLLNQSVVRKFQKNISSRSVFLVEDVSIVERSRSRVSDGVISNDVQEVPVGFKFMLDSIRTTKDSLFAKMNVEDSRLIDGSIRRFKTHSKIKVSINKSDVVFSYTYKEKSQVEKGLPFLPFYPFTWTSDIIRRKTVLFSVLIKKRT